LVRENTTKLPFLIFLGRRLWSLWVGLWFIGYFIFLFPLYYWFLRKETSDSLKVGHKLNRLWGKVILAAGMIRVKVIDNARLDASRNWIFVANHRSYLDIPVCYLAMPQPFRFIGKAELGKLPLFGFMYRKLHILVDRESKMARMRALILAGQRLKQGNSLFIYPEGTTRHPKDVLLGNFQEGAFILSAQNNVPIVPVTLIKTAQAMSDDGKFLIRPGVTVKVIIDPPLSPDGVSMNEIEKLKNQCYQIIFNNLKSYTANGN
jgi:1-acyl-sn-glycerol-3-phosphate acyltransferase